MDPLAIYTSCRLRDSAGAIVAYDSPWWRGAPVNWRIAIFNADGTLNDLGGITKIVLTLTDMVNGGPGKNGYISREYPAGDLNPDLTAQEWGDRTAWHFQAALDGEDTLIPASPSGTKYWAILEAGTSDGELIPLAALQVTLRSTTGSGPLDRDPIGMSGSVTYGGPPLTYGGEFITAE